MIEEQVFWIVLFLFGLLKEALVRKNGGGIDAETVGSVYKIMAG